jgi:exosortase
MSGGVLQASEPTQSQAAARRRKDTPLPGWLEYVGPLGAIKVVVLAALIGWLYWAEFTRMYILWKSPDWSHGFLIPVFSLYIINLRKKDLILGEHPGSVWGIAAILISLLVYVKSIQMQIGYPQSLSVIATIGGLVLLLRGWRSLWICAFPIAFLLLAVPPPERYYRALTQPLQQLAAAIATVVLNSFPGAEVSREGINLNYIMNSGLEGTFTVAGACSGMRSLMAFVALGLATAYFAPRPAWQRAAMALAVIPVAVFCNVLRVIITGCFQMYGHANLASGTPHAILGFAMFGLGFTIYLGIQWLLDHLVVEVDEAD